MSGRRAMIEKSWETDEEHDTMALGREVGKALQGGEWIALSGELGAGKTRFVRGLAEGIGCCEEDVCSPTFVLMNEYLPSCTGRPRLLHLDAYRLTDDDDLSTLGLDVAMRTSPGEPPPVLAIEWPERLPGGMPEDAIEVRIEHLGDMRRRITIRCPDDLHEGRA